MNEVIKNMEERRSVRGYKPDMIRKEDLDTIIEAGTYAATGMGMQSPIIVAVTDKATRDQLSAMNAKIMGTDTDPFYGAPKSCDGKSDECSAFAWNRKLLDPPGKRRI